MSQTLQAYIHESIAQCPRNMFDLMRNISLFIPNDHGLSVTARKCLDSLSFSPPENYGLHIGIFLAELNEYFPEHEFAAAPWWVKAISVLVCGGANPEPWDMLNRELLSDHNDAVDIVVE